MPANTALKSRPLDDKDVVILTMLQENSRETLTNMARKVGLSIDSVNNRIKEMRRKEIFDLSISINPRAIGFPLVTDVKIKLENITEDQKASFISYLTNHAHVTDLLSVMGDFDFTCVIVARSTEELDTISTEIRQRFSGIIADWKSILVMKTHKFDTYDLSGLKD